ASTWRAAGCLRRTTMWSPSPSSVALAPCAAWTAHSLERSPYHPQSFAHASEPMEVAHGRLQYRVCRLPRIDAARFHGAAAGPGEVASVGNAYNCQILRTRAE